MTTWKAAEPAKINACAMIALMPPPCHENLRLVLFGPTYPRRTKISHLGDRATYLLGRDIGPAGGRATYLPLLPFHSLLLPLLPLLPTHYYFWQYKRAAGQYMYKRAAGTVLVQKLV